MILVLIGTTNSCVSDMDGKTHRVLKKAEGTRTKPSVVAFINDGNRLVCTTVKRQTIIKSTNILQTTKRLTGGKFDDPERVPPCSMGVSNEWFMILCVKEVTIYKFVNIYRRNYKYVFHLLKLVVTTMNINI